MNGFDIIFLIVLVLGAWKGWSSGLLREVLGLIGIIVGLYLARLFYEQVGYQLAPHIGCSPSVANIMAFVLIWLGVPILLNIIGTLLTKVLEWLGVDSVNRLGGALVCIIKYGLLLGVLCNVLSITNLVTQEAQQSSILFGPFKQSTSIAFDLAKSHWPQNDE